MSDIKPVDHGAYFSNRNKLKVIVCDHCKKEFLFKGVKIEELKVHDTASNGYFNYKYFRCPHCQVLYSISVDTDLTRMLRQEYEDALEKFKKLVNKIPRDTKKIEKRSVMLEIKKKRLDDCSRKTLELLRETFEKLASENK